MPTTIALSLLAPLTVYLGLNFVGSASLTFLLYHGLVCAAIPLIDLVCIKKQALNSLLPALGFTGFRRSLPSAVGVGLLFGISTYLFLYVLRDQVLELDQIETVMARWRLNPDRIIPLMIMMVLGNSILEEIYWRGYIFQRFRGIVAPHITIILTALFYTSYHLITTLSLFPSRYACLFSLVIFGAGIFWGHVRQRTGSIYFPILTHFMADLGFMLIYFQFFGR